MEDTNNQDTIGNNEDNADESYIEEEVDNDIEYLLTKKILQRLKENDPNITCLSVSFNYTDHIDGECVFDSINWKEDGDSIIANNKHIKTLNICYDGVPFNRPRGQHYILGEEGHKTSPSEGRGVPTRQQLQDFFLCIYRSDSIVGIEIQSMFIVDEFGSTLMEGLSGHPSLKRIQTHLGRLPQSRLGSIGCIAIGNVLKHSESKLNDLHLSNCQLDDEGLSALCDGLLGISTVKKLSLSGNNISPVGWRALSPVIQHKNCKLVALDLSKTGIDDDSSGILGSVLRGSSIKTLNISNTKAITSDGWQKLIVRLSHTSIMHLVLNSSNIDDYGLALLVNIGTLKSLNLWQTRCTPQGWSSFFYSLQARGAQLVKLDISLNSNIGDIGLQALGDLLNNMASLKTLGMSHIRRYNNFDVTSQEWVSFFTMFQDSNLDLVKLDLNSNTIDDEDIQLLVQLVSGMNSLKRLVLNHNILVTPTGWRALSGFFQSPNFALRELYLEGNKLSNDTVITFVRALLHNKTLKRLTLARCTDEEGNDSITERGWEAVSSLLCNKTSIMDTYNSNHTLYALCEAVDYHRSMGLPNDLLSYLELNENKDKREVARQKILQTHFSSEDDTASKVQEFFDMELEEIPTAIAWIGRLAHDKWIGANVSGLSLSYNLLRRLPDLFDSNAQKKSGGSKRKRDL